MNGQNGDNSHICHGFDIGDWEGLVVLRLVFADGEILPPQRRSPCYLIDPGDARAVAARLSAAADLADTMASAKVATERATRH